MLLTAVYMGFTNGIAPIFSYHFGARGFGELRRLVRLSLTVIVGSALLSFGLAHLLAAPLISLFLPQGGHVYELTRQGFALFSFTFLLCGFDIFISAFFTAISDGRTSALMSFARNLLGIALDRSSGFDVLDQHAQSLLASYGDLPPLPEALEASEIQVIVPINYKLRKTT